MWTTTMILYLRENYSRLGAIECARVLGKSVNSIRITANRNGIKRYPE